MFVRMKHRYASCGVHTIGSPRTLKLVLITIGTPVSFVWRLTGRDPLARRRDKWPGWSVYPERYRNRKHYEQMY